MASRRELVVTVERQKEEIANYRAKLKDVVRAYQGLLKEKEALESSLSVLSGGAGGSGGGGGGAEAVGGSQPTKEDPSPVDPTSQPHDKEGEETDEGTTASVAGLQKKVSALTTALATVSSEKKRIELSFQNDKKRLLAEREKLERSVQEALDARQALEMSTDERIQELRSQLIVAQHERDQDFQHSAVMLRELESKLSVERNKREQVEAALEEAKQKVQSVTPAATTTRPLEHYEKKITDLQNELEQVRCRLRRAEQQAQEPPLLKKIQQQMQEMKTQHTQAMQQERIRATSVEGSARDIAQQNEERVVSLEGRLQELSLAVASYDRTRQEDLQAIHKLKERVSELAQENAFLLSRLEPDTDNSETDINGLCRRLVKLKEQLVSANVNSEHPVDIEHLLHSGENIHSRCQQEYDQLKEEFENYKISSKQQSKEKACKEDCSQQLEELRQKVRSLTSAAQHASESHTQQVAALRQEVAAVKAQQDGEMRRLEGEHRATVAGLEQQLSQQQQRSLATLTDRDNEIQRLTQQLHQRENTPPQAGLGGLEATVALLSRVGGGSEGPLLHHLEELARRQQEVAQLRRENRQLETTMREIQMAAVVKQQAQQEAIDTLREEAERHRRNLSREGENLEYLKNVVLKYMVSSDAECRQLMLNAIAAVLKFTSREVESVKRYNALWWWQPAPKTSGPPTTTYL